MKTPLNRLSATRLARMIAGHEVTCEAVTHSFIDAVKQREPDIRAFAWFDPQRALATARELDIGDWRGPLHGLPVAVKDNMATSRRPPDGVARSSWQRLEQLEVTLATLMLVEADIGLDGDTGTRVAKVGVAT